MTQELLELRSLLESGRYSEALMVMGLTSILLRERHD